MLRNTQAYTAQHVSTNFAIQLSKTRTEQTSRSTINMRAKIITASEQHTTHTAAQSYRATEI